MSRRNKLQKFAEVFTFPNVYENFNPETATLTGENGAEIDMKGHWRSRHFKNDLPLVLELACGKGDYTIGLAARNPRANFIGVDIKGARIWRGAKTAIEAGLPNAAFLRTRIELINNFFEHGEVDEIWITFPDPFLRNSKANRRLTSPPFLDRYSTLLKPGGLVHLKTDDPTLYEYTLEVLAHQQRYSCLARYSDIYAGPLPTPELDIKTYYEKKHLLAGKTIKYVCFRLEP